MALLTPLWMSPDYGFDPIQYPLSQDRVAFMGSVFSRTGVLDLLGGHFRVAQRSAGANMTVDISPGRGAVDDTLGGMYLCTSTAIENVAISKPSSGSRTHRVILQVRDKSQFGDAASDCIVTTVFSNSTTPPATPPRAISLAVIQVTSSTTSVTASIITDVRSRATVGTMGVTGSWGASGISPVWQNYDSSRPLTWMKNTDGWVYLSGWIRRQNSTSSVNAGDFWNLDQSKGYWATGDSPLPPEIRPPVIRDVAVMTAGGTAHFAILPSGRMPFRFFQNMTFSAASGSEFWMSFDGVFFKQSQGR